MFRACLLFPLVNHYVTGLSLKVTPPPSDGTSFSRRDALVAGTVVSLATLTSNILQPTRNDAAWAFVDEYDAQPSTSFPPQRMALLQKISQRASDEEIALAMSELEPLDPSKGTAATSPELGGTWELIYSVNAEAFSPLLNLPKPIRPTSIQLIGDAATQVVGKGRIAQVLNFPILPLSLILSSGAVPVESDSSLLEIFPPFRLEAQLGNSKVQLVESGSDADFRALNARSAEAQAAGRNLYKQRYLENTGKRGDLRISEVIAGDPVLVGEVFVHRRM